MLGPASAEEVARIEFDPPVDPGGYDMHEIPDVKLLLETELDALSAYVTYETEEPYKNVAAIDLCDGAQTVEHQELVALSTSWLVRRASKVRNALERLREGSYGLCEGCCSPIPAPRLAAVPTATTCLPCQSELEQRQPENPHRPSAIKGRAGSATRTHIEDGIAPQTSSISDTCRVARVKRTATATAVIPGRPNQ